MEICPRQRRESPYVCVLTCTLDSVPGVVSHHAAGTARDETDS
jgi:hypothetical protein